MCDVTIIFKNCRAVFGPTPKTGNKTDNAISTSIKNKFK